MKSELNDSEQSIVQALQEEEVLTTGTEERSENIPELSVYDQRNKRKASNPNPLACRQADDHSKNNKKRKLAKYKQ